MRVDGDAPDEEIARSLEEDRLWATYGLCDLEPAHRLFARYLLAEPEDSTVDEREGRGWCLIYAPGSFSSVVVGGHPAAVAAALRQAMDLPSPTIYMAPADPMIPAAEDEPYLDALRVRYRLKTQRPMLRMVLAEQTRLLEPRRPLPADATLCRLGPPDAAELSAFYDADPYRAFTPAMLEGVYYGVRRGGRIVAAAGTHALSPRHGVAMLGNVFTTPAERGLGQAQATTAAVVRELRAHHGCRDVGLNVVAGNAPAVAVYNRLGFRVYCPFWEGRATLIREAHRFGPQRASPARDHVT